MLRAAVLRLAAATAACFAAAAAPVQAQRTLTILPVAAPTSMDPHFESHPLNYGPQRQIYDSLLTLDTEAVLRPYLAEAWRQLDDRTWEFRLREGVRFHDGTPFEAEDVAFSVARAAAVTGNQGSYAALVRGIAAVEVGAEPRALLVRTREPDPFLDRSMASILLLSRRVHAGATREDFYAGRLAVGTGPYRHVAYTRGERHEIAANPDFWGGRPPWDRVTTRYVADDNARLAALRAGEADLIDTVPPGEVARLSADPQLAVFGGDGSRTIFLNPDSARERVPHVWDRHGLPLERNPLRDRRVREALSLAIDRQGIVERALFGQGRPAEQIVSPRAPDRAPDLPPLPFDPERARRLLAEAGYPDGFRMTLHGIVEDVPDGAGVLREIAEGFGRAGIETRVEGGPWQSLAPRILARDFAVFRGGWGGSLAASTLRAVAMTPNPETGAGFANRIHYSNPAVDAPLAEARRTMDPARRAALTAQAMRALVEDHGLIPILTVRNNWAGRREKLRYDAHFLGITSALLATPVDLSGGPGTRGGDR